MAQGLFPLTFVPIGVFIALACGTGDGARVLCPQTGVKRQALIQPVPNLAPNGSHEVKGETGDSPQSWTRLQWGVHDARFSYDLGGGRTGSAVSVEIGSYTNGDARWAFEPVLVASGERYVYLDYYRSSVSTKLVAMYAASDGTVHYETLRTVPASTSWAAAGVMLTPPAGTYKASVEHVLAAAGRLQLDDVRFALPQPPDLESGAPNGALEQPDDIDPTQPLAWQSAAWGENQTSFVYEDAGKTGRSIGVRTASYTDGNAAWYFAPQRVKPNTHYAYSDTYKSDVESFLSARWTLPDGSYRYEKLASAPAASEYTELRRDLFSSADAVELTVLHGLERVGALQLDDVGLRARGTRDFQRALVSITFDDSWRSDYTAALSSLDRHDLVATHYVVTGLIDQPKRLSWAMVEALFRRGHEIGAHTESHPDLVKVDEDALANELDAPPRALQQRCLGAAEDFSSPFGSYDDRTLTAIRARYRSHRSTELGFNTKVGFDRYRLKVQSLRASTPLDQIHAWADEAEATKSWLILVYHDVTSPAASSYSVTPAALESQLGALADHGLKVVTVRQALDELLPQLE